MKQLLQCHEVAPITAENRLQTRCCGDQDVRLTGFNLLHGANVQVCQLGQFVLRQAFFEPKSADVATEGSKLCSDDGIHHGTLCRMIKIDSTAQWGVKRTPEPFTVAGKRPKSPYKPARGAIRTILKLSWEDLASTNDY